jgi:hypothetical protein
VHPGAVAKALLESKGDNKQLPPGDKKYKLGDFTLPIPSKELNLLPIIFVVKDVGSESLGRRNVPRARPFADAGNRKNPRVSRAGSAACGRARITLPRVSQSHVPDWNIVLRLTAWRFRKRCRKARGSPRPRKAGDVLEIEPKDYSRFLRAISGFKKKGEEGVGSAELDRLGEVSRPPPPSIESMSSVLT